MDLEKYKKIFVQESSKYLDELDIILMKRKMICQISNCGAKSMARFTL